MPNEFITHDEFARRVTELAKEHGLTAGDFFPSEEELVGELNEWIKATKHWHVRPGRSLFGNMLVWRVHHDGMYKFTAVSLDSAMQFIGRYERGEMK